MSCWARDGFVNRTGFNAGFIEDGLYAGWDAEDDNHLSEDEFGGGVYEACDADEDEQWNVQEYGAYEDDGWF